MFLRAISTSAVHYARAKPTPLIKNYPVVLRLLFPSWRMATSHEFYSAEAITKFLSEPKKFLLDPETGHAIHPDQVEKIDPNTIYEVAGSGLPYPERGVTREQVWDTVFEKKTALALKKVLEEEDPKVKELPRVIKNGGGNMVSEWEGIYQLSDGRIVFLETKFKMSKTHIDNQLKRVSKSLAAMGKAKCARLYLAAYSWPDEDCISYARSKGYGIMQPNGSDLAVHVKAEVLHIN